MTHSTFKTSLKALSMHKKLVMVGAFLAFASVFMPWYQDIDRFKTGDMFLGITGPMYLGGIIVLAVGAAAFGLILLELLEKPKPKLPMKEEHFFIAGGAISLFLLVLAASVYFHPKFGINLVDKSVGFGMIISFVGSGLLLFGGIMLARKTDVNFNQEGELKPLIDVDIKERVQSSIAPEKTNEELEEENLKKEATIIGRQDPIQTLLDKDDF